MFQNHEQNKKALENLLFQFLESPEWQIITTCLRQQNIHGILELCMTTEAEITRGCQVDGGLQHLSRGERRQLRYFQNWVQHLYDNGEDMEWNKLGPNDLWEFQFQVASKLNNEDTNQPCSERAKYKNDLQVLLEVEKKKEIRTTIRLQNN